MTKFCFFTKRPFKKIKITLQSQNVIALNLYVDINELVYEKKLMMKIFSLTKCVKKTFLGKTCYILSNNVPINNFRGVNPSPKYVQAHI